MISIGMSDHRPSDCDLDFKHSTFAFQGRLSLGERRALGKRAGDDIGLLETKTPVVRSP